LRCHGVDFVEAEFEPIGFLRQLAGPSLAVFEVAAGGQPVVAHGPVALELRFDVGEAVKCRSLFVGPHQPQLVVLPVKRKQFGSEGGQRLRRHAAAAEVSARRPVAADRARRDDAAVVVAFSA
jgi:hypothetical protein